MSAHIADFDAILVLSFGGPEGRDDVIPFLENVTRGRGIPRERLEEVAHHYYHFDGVSPITRLNREIITNLEQALVTAGIDIPVYFGNRNWHPMVEDTVEKMHQDGITKAAVFATSAWGGYSGCRQYHEDISRAIAHLAKLGSSLELVKMRQFFGHPVFVNLFASALSHSISSLSPAGQQSVHVAFTAHSVPNSADKTAGPAERGGHLYSQQVAQASQLVAEIAEVKDFSVVWQSRSGPPQIPWLDPDICDHIEQLAAQPQAPAAVVVCPIGFISDHMEVVWDLDHEAAETAAEKGMEFARVPTPGAQPEFADMIIDLFTELTTDTPSPRWGDIPHFGSSSNGEPCNRSCCEPAKRPTR